jgi:hypothetical protein
MKHCRGITLLVLLVGTALGGSELPGRIDLKRLLSDPAALDRLTIEYRPSYKSVLFIYGTGRVVKQALPNIGSSEIVPTCTGKIGQTEVKGLVEEFIDRHFLNLPVKTYYFITASDDSDDFGRALSLHSITIDDGESRASRQFADGVYQDQKQMIPADFAALEEVMVRIEKSAIGDKPCHMAPGISLPSRHVQDVSVPRNNHITRQ